MDTAVVMKERKEQLKVIRDQLQEELIAAELRESEDEGPDVLMVIFDELGFMNDDGAVGEFFFQPIGSEEDSVQHFVSTIILAGDPDMTNAAGLYQTISVLNGYLPCGCFCLDRNSSFLLYKLVTPLPMSLSGDALSEEINICMGNAVAVTDQYADFVLGVMEGRMTPEEVMDQIAGEEESE